MYHWTNRSVYNWLLWGGRWSRPHDPRFGQLLAKPAETLAGGPVRIGPARTLPAVLLLLAMAPAIAWYFTGEWTWRGSGIAIGVVALLGSWPIVFPQRLQEMVLSADGVELKHRGTVVFCPWALFNAPGNPFTEELHRFSLPVQAAAIPFVEWRRDGACIGQGIEVKAPQLKFREGANLVLSNRYEIPPVELGELLLRLGRLLGSRLPSGAAPAEAYPDLSASTTLAPSPEDWLTVSLTRLPFPPVCCACGAATTSVQTATARSRLDTVVRLLTLFHWDRTVSVPVPLCAACCRAYRRRGWWEGFLSLSAGAGAGFVLTLLALWLAGLANRPGFWGLCFIGSTFGAVIGPLLGSEIGWGQPFQVARYDPRRRTVAVRFRNPDYHLQVLAAVHVSGQKD